MKKFLVILGFVALCGTPLLAEKAPVKEEIEEVSRIAAETPTEQAAEEVPAAE